MAAIRVMVVDDSVVVRKIVTEVLGAESDIDVVGTAIHGRAALEKLEALAPDVVTMDVEMPEMDGIEAVRRIRAVRPHLPIIMFSSLTERSARATFDALAAGANDYVTKPTQTGSIAASMESVRVQLLPRLRALTGRSAPTSPAAPASSPDGAPQPGAPAGWPDRPPAPPAPRAEAPARRLAARALVLGASTGGPEALTEVITHLPGDLAVPVLVVQHMPPVFTTQFAARLDRLAALRVVEAVDATVLEAGTVYLAPGGLHLEAAASAGLVRTRLTQAPPENYCRPSVDVLFRSAVTAFSGAVLCAVLTGMGADGRTGAGAVRAAGGWVVAQDEATSVVWGMPGAVAAAGHADEVLPLHQVAPALVRRLPRGAARPAPAPAARPVAPAATSGGPAWR